MYKILRFTVFEVTRFHTVSIHMCYQIRLLNDCERQQNQAHDRRRKVGGYALSLKGTAAKKNKDETAGQDIFG